MNKFISIIFLSALTGSAFAEINTQYPGCTPAGSTATEVDTRPKDYYPKQPALNKEALEADQAIKQNRE